MIRINLLPFRAARRKENIRRQISIFCLMLVFAVACQMYYTSWVDRKIRGLNEEIDQVRYEITLYKKKADRVNQIKKDLRNLELKLDIVKGLEAERRGPISLIDALTRLIIPERMWLTSLKTGEKKVFIKGMAFDNKTVADFMTAVERSPLFGRVDLNTLQMKSMQRGIRVKAFEVVCEKRSAKEAAKAKDGNAAHK